MSVSVRPVRSSSDLLRFIRLPWSLYPGDTNWIPPLISAEKKLLDRNRNPFFRHAQAEYFLAEEGGDPVGRIAAIVNENHNAEHGENCGFFGFFECRKDPDTARALFDAAEGWLRDRGMTKVMGPANPSLNDPCGFVIDGHKWPPFVLMTYNPRYYTQYVETLGYAKSMDMYAYILLQNELVKEKIDRVAAEIQDRGDIRIRNVQMSRFEEELQVVMDIYNNAWSRNWGFVPMTEAEIRFAAKDMKSVILPELTFVAEYGGEPVGFSLALPDINHVLRKCNGRLLPFGWFYFLKFNLRKIPTFRIVALGVKRELQHKGIGTLFYQRYMEDGSRLGYKAAELSWVLENNELMNRPIQQMGGKPYKTYRIYEKSLGGERGPSSGS